MINPRVVQIVNKCKVLGDGTCPCQSTCYFSRVVDRAISDAMVRSDFETAAYLQEHLTSMMRKFENED